jgi:CubicO group peptidase (beta-lactamase class C family)
VAPGESPGTLTLSGNFAQTAGGFFDVGLDGASFGQLLISGSASLNGTIDAICFGTCNYDVGTSWEVMRADRGVTGKFAGSVLMTGFSSGAFMVDYSHDNQVWLTVTEATVGAVPEPGTYALMFSGVAVIGWLARRKQRA